MFTYTEIVLLVWAAVASGLAGAYRAGYKDRGELLESAASFTKKLVEDDKMRDDLRQMFRTMRDVEVKFNKGE